MYKYAHNPSQLYQFTTQQLTTERACMILHAALVLGAEFAHTEEQVFLHIYCRLAANYKADSRPTLMHMSLQNDELAQPLPPSPLLKILLRLVVGQAYITIRQKPLSAC